MLRLYPRVLLAAAVAAPLVGFAACSSSPAAHGTTGGAATSTTAPSSSSGGMGGMGGMQLLTTGSGVFTSGSGSATCGDSDAAPDAALGCDGLDGGVAYNAEVQQPIFNMSCTGELCHNPPTYGLLVGQPASECCDGELLVKPGDADHSYLMNKLAGHALCFGSQMPFGEAPLPEDQQLLIRTWICEGAPDN